MLLRKNSPMNDSIDDPVPDIANLMKMEAGTRSTVQFKPSKRMKKRRQLDALVASDKKLSRRKHSAHELLRSSNDSGSSEVDDFSVLHGHRLNKSCASSSCCMTCCGLTVTLLVTCCVLASAALTWLHLQLRHDFSDLRDRLIIVENRHTASPEDVQDLKIRLTAMDKTLSDLRTGDSGLQALNKSIATMQAQIASLTTAQQQQQQNMQAANSQNHDDVTKTVTSLGSDLQTTNAEVKTMKETQSKLSTDMAKLTDRVVALENPNGKEGGLPLDTEGLQMQVSQLNSTLSQFIAKASAELDKQQSHMEAVDNFLQTLQGQVTSTFQLTTGLNQSQHVIMEALGDFVTDAELTQLQTQVNDLHQTLEKGLLLLEQLKSGNTTNIDTDLSSPPPSESYFQELLRDHEDFVHFKNEMYQDISSLNATMAAVNVSVEGVRREVVQLSSTVDQTAANLTDLTHTVLQILSRDSTHPDESLTTKLPLVPDHESELPLNTNSESASH